MNKFLFIIIFCLSFNFCQAYQIDQFDFMPIMQALPQDLHGYAPKEQRGEEYRRFLCSSVKISVSGASGSGTIVYYDSNKNLAYVASCGHLWNESIMTADEGKIKNKKCKIIVFYQNDKKLDSPKSYEANVIFYSNINSCDTSLVTFNPDWTPNYYPIAPKEYRYNLDSTAHSCGCDHGSEVAHYSIRIKAVGNDIVTYENSPRPGRSGGGLMDDDGYYIGTCWGTQFIDGSGEGFFTTLSDIHNFWSKQGYNFLLHQKLKKNLAQLIPIVNKTEKQKDFSQNYILTP